VTLNEYSFIHVIRLLCWRLTNYKSLNRPTPGKHYEDDGLNRSQIPIYSTVNQSTVTPHTCSELSTLVTMATGDPIYAVVDKHRGTSVTSSALKASRDSSHVSPNGTVQLPPPGRRRGETLVASTNTDDQRPTSTPSPPCHIGANTASGDGFLLIHLRRNWQQFIDNRIIN